MAEPVAEVGNNLDAFYDDHSHLDYNPQDHEHFDEEDIPQPPSLRDEIRHRKEKEKQDDEAQFTFRPQVNAYKKGHPLANDAVKENRFDKLYGDALKRHLTSQVKVSEDPSKRDKDLTFKPKISTLGAKQSRSSSRERLGISRSNSRSRDASHSRDASQERGDSRDRSGLASDSEDTTNNNRTGRSRSNSNTGLNRSRGVSKILEEQQAMMTFRPVISKRAKSIERQRQQEDQNIVERLYQKEKQVKEKMDQKKSDIEQLRMQECTFAPSVVTKPKPFSGQSNLEVTERLRRFEEMKKKKLEEALRKREEEEAEKLTFKPQISRRAQSPSASVSLSQDFVNLSLEERLMTPTKRRNSRAEEEASRELTFKPKLVAKRAPSPSAAAASSDYKTPHERLYVEGSIHKREIEHKREQIRTSLDRELTFSPELATKGHGQRQRDVSPDSHLFERLNAYVKGEPDKIEKLRRDREAELTFQPQLTKRTLEIAVRSPDSEMTIYERQKAEQDRMQIELDMRRQQQEEEKMKALTFQPQVPESSKELARRRSQANIDAGGDCASVFSMSVHSRLASMYTISSATQSLAGMNDNATIMTENTKPEEPLHPRNSLVLPEEKVSQLVRRLSMHKKVEEAPSEVRVKVMSPEKYEEAVQRLSMQKTMSFTLKTDAAQLEAVQPKLIKEPPKVTTEQMNEILERLQSPTVSAAVSAETPRESPLGNNPLLRTASGRSFVMSTSQFNLLMSTAAAGAAAVHGSPSPTRRHTFASPPKASFFGTPLTAIPAAENEEGHEDEHDEDSDEDDDRKGVSEVKMPDHSQATTANPYARGTRRIDSLADLEVEMVEEEGSDEEEEEEERRRQAAKNSANKKKAAPVSASKKTPTTASKASPRKSVTSSTPTAASPVKKPVPVATPVTVRGAATTTPGSNGSRSTTPTSARRHSAPTPAAATSPVRPTSAGRRPAPSATATAAVATATTPTVLNRATPKSSLPTATSGTGEFVDEFEKKLQMTMAMLKPLDAMPPAPPAAQPAAPAVAQPVAQRVMQPVVESLPVPPVVPSNTSVAGLFPLPESQPTVQPVSTPAAPTAVIEEVNEPAPEPEVVVSETVVVEAERPVSPVVEVPAATAESAPQQEEVAVAPPTDETPNTPRESTAIDDAVETTPAHHPVDEVAATPDTPLNGSSANVLTSVDSAWTMGTSADEGDEEDDDGEEVDMQASSLSLRSSTGGGSDKKKKKKKKKKGSKK